MNLLRVLEGIVDDSISPQERLILTKKALKFFRVLSKKSVLNAHYPNRGIPEGIYKLARKMGDGTEVA